MARSRANIRKHPPTSSRKPKAPAKPPAAGKASASTKHDDIAAQFAARMDALRSAGAAWPGAIAVSGGGDSVALMLLLAAYTKHAKLPPPVILTVDHGLRESSAKDARAVVKMAADIGLKAHALVWKGPHPKSDIEAEARAARYRLMGEWLVAHKIAALYVAHTMEDQAETFLLRLARGSGLDGLSAMRVVAPYPMPDFPGLMIVRPLLDMARAPLRDFLRNKRQSWLEDPMNGDPRFARSKLRAAWPQLEALGLSAQRVSDAAEHLGRAREALDDMTASLLMRAARFDGAGALIDSVRLKMAPREVGLRALASTLSRVSGEAYRPRFGKLERLFDAIRDGSLAGGATLHGCIVAPAPRPVLAFGTGTLLVTREAGRAGPEKPAASAQVKEPAPTAPSKKAKKRRRN